MKDATYAGTPYPFFPTSMDTVHKTDDGMMIIRGDGSQEWFVHGRLHRLNGPAMIKPNGAEFWLVDGLFHRLDGPAITIPGIMQEWWQMGVRHRNDGPSVIHFTDEDDPIGRYQWWLWGREITTEVEIWQKEQNIPTFAQWTDREKVLFRVSF